MAEPNLNGNLGRKLSHARQRIKVLEQTIRDLKSEVGSCQFTIDRAKRVIPADQWDAVFHAKRQRVCYRDVEREQVDFAAEYLNSLDGFSCHPNWHIIGSEKTRWSVEIYSPDRTETRDMWLQDLIGFARRYGWTG